MNIHHELILELVEDLKPRHPKHTFKGYSSNYDDIYTGIDVHAKTGGRSTMLLTREQGIQIVVDFDHRPIIDYADPQLFEKIDKILEEILT